MELTCHICCNDFGEGVCRPRMLSCGHTHCHSCIEKFIESMSPCPMCNAVIEQTHVSDIPVNFYVVSLLKNGKEDHCLDHSALSLTCMKCYKILCKSYKSCETVKVSDALTGVQSLEFQIQLLQKSNEQREKYIKKLSEFTNEAKTKLEEETKLKREYESLLKNLEDEKEKKNRISLKEVPKSELFDFLQKSPAVFCRVNPKQFLDKNREALFDPVTPEDSSFVFGKLHFRENQLRIESFSRVLEDLPYVQVIISHSKTRVVLI